MLGVALDSLSGFSAQKVRMGIARRKAQNTAAGTEVTDLRTLVLAVQGGDRPAIAQLYQRFNNFPAFVSLRFLRQYNRPTCYTREEIIDFGRDALTEYLIRGMPEFKYEDERGLIRHLGIVVV